jgi:hypothetical protein
MWREDLSTSKVSERATARKSQPPKIILIRKPRIQENFCHKRTQRAQKQKTKVSDFYQNPFGSISEFYVFFCGKNGFQDRSGSRLRGFLLKNDRSGLRRKP